MLLVTPLVALARQQAQRLADSGVPVFLSAGTPGSASPRPGEAGTWIVSPESLCSPARQEALRAWQPQFLTVDECHCLWEWGQDFRPAFNPLPELLREHKIPRSLWLTATLPWEARQSLRAQLPAESIAELGHFDLPARLSLTIARVPWPERAEALVDSVRSRAGEAGLVFVSTRESTLRVSRLLAGLGLRSMAYHAGLSVEERKNIEAQVRGQALDVVVATSAFGMGMDFGHLRWVALWQAPPSLLALAQAIGRVGRGDVAGRAWVFWDSEDFRLLEWTLSDDDPTSRRRRELVHTWEFLQNLGCRRLGLKAYFEGPENKLDRLCGRCDACASIVSIGKYSHN